MCVYMCVGKSEHTGSDAKSAANSSASSNSLDSRYLKYKQIKEKHEFEHIEDYILHFFKVGACNVSIFSCPRQLYVCVSAYC